MMRKRWKALTLVLLLALCAAGCSKKLSDRFDRDALEEKVSTVISLAVQGDYDTLYEEEFSQQIHHPDRSGKSEDGCGRGDRTVGRVSGDPEDHVYGR